MIDEIDQKDNALVLSLHKHNPTYEARNGCYQAKKEEVLDAIESLETRLKKKLGKKKIFRCRC